MPELPEVETVVRDLCRAGLAGRAIRAVRLSWPRTVAPLAPAAFARRLRGRTIRSIRRRAKYLVLTLSGGDTLLVHLRMTGRFDFAAAGAPPDRHTRVALQLEDGRELRYLDPRKFGRWTLTREPRRILDALGPEPLSADFQAARFAAALARRRRLLKPLLLDQTFVAGLGNIYTDEALWDARLHPLRRADTLTPREAQRLYAAIRRVLRRGVARRGTSLGSGRANYYSVGGRRGRNQDGLRVFRRTGEPCPRCRAPIRRLTVGQRGTHLCPACQTL